MKKSLWLLAALTLVISSICLFYQPIISAAGDQVMRINDSISLLHPRRGMQLTLVGDKIWVTGGLAYESHFGDWGKGKYAKFTSYPNVEIIDLATQKVTYTSLATGGKDYYKSTAFKTSDDSPIIYMAAANLLAKVDTEKMTFTPIKDFGEHAERTKGSWGYMTIKGKKYTVLVTEDKMISFFDAATEKFVKIPGVKSEIQNSAAYGAIVNNKFYIFGGNPAGDDAGGVKAFVFDPNLAEADQIQALPDMPLPMATGTAAAMNDKIYILGGSSDGDFSQAVLEFDPATNKYIRRTDLPRGGTNTDSCIKGDTVYYTYGYSWGTAEEGKLGFRTHPSAVVEYKPGLDTTDQPFTAKTSVSGKYMNITLGWPDANKIYGKDQNIAISWMANTASTSGKLYYRVKGSENFETMTATSTSYAVSLAEAKSYRVIMSGLKPKTEYEYYVVSEGKEAVKSAVYTFRTQPVKVPNNFQVFAYGDSKAEYHINNEINGFLWKNIQESQAAGKNPIFAMQLGDFGAGGAIPEFEAWFNYGRTKNYTQPMLAQFPFMAVHGNHENLLPSFFNTFVFPANTVTGWPEAKSKGNLYYSFNYGKAHFIVLTTGSYLKQDWYTKDQLEWLKQDLAYSKQQKEDGKINWVLVVWHTNVLTTGDHFKDLDAQGFHNPGFYLDVIEDSKVVDVTLGAHDHHYERSKAVLGYRWKKEPGGKIYYYKTDKAYADPNSGAFGETKQGNGIVHFIIGTAGASQRDLSDKVGDLSWLARRKPAPERGEAVKDSPVFGYLVLNFSNKALDIEFYEFNVKPMLKEVADDSYEGLLDSITITR